MEYLLVIFFVGLACSLVIASLSDSEKLQEEEFFLDANVVKSINKALDLDFTTAWVHNAQTHTSCFELTPRPDEPWITPIQKQTFPRISFIAPPEKRQRDFFQAPVEELHFAAWVMWNRAGFRWTKQTRKVGLAG